MGWWEWLWGPWISEREAAHIDWQPPSNVNQPRPPPNSPREQKWILLPPHVTPPGVHPSADGLDLATPVTLAEWFEAFYTEAAKGPVRMYGGFWWGWVGGCVDADGGFGWIF